MGHQEVRLPTSPGSGKVQPHSIRQIRETGLGEKMGEKKWMVGTDESTGEGVKLVWKEEPKKNENMDRDFQGKNTKQKKNMENVFLAGLRWCAQISGVSFFSLYNIIVSTYAILFQVLHPAPSPPLKPYGAVCTLPTLHSRAPCVWREIRGDVPEGVKCGRSHH